ncbi:hypothetical protein M436DRAFT_66715 [Aureobasidium namibiae CBS 147.97]|uniref:Uncharacterized protein n=1 Tax=Aureobasidium namibiae CBS 147.97 TaxID=1043004 RepID=A0A074X5I7_9PEZI
MGYDKASSKVDVVVRYVDQKYYQATIADKSSGEDICVEPQKSKTVEAALEGLLAHTCSHLGNPPNLIGAGATQKDSPLLKRGRGRPKSVLPSAISSAVKPKAKRAAPAASTMVADVTPGAKRGVGRPKKQDAAAPASISRPRGRQRKSPTAPVSTGRPVGRPRKNPVATALATEVTEDGTTALIKRGRGRPKKSDSTPVAATAPKRDASALEDDEDEEPAVRKSRKITTDDDFQELIGAYDLGDIEEAGQAAPYTPQVWFPTYVSRIARVVYQCIADGADGGLTEDEIMEDTGLAYSDISAGISQLSEKGGIEPAIEDSARWVVIDEWEDEDE